MKKIKPPFTRPQIILFEPAFLPGISVPTPVEPTEAAKTSQVSMLCPLVAAFWAGRCMLGTTCPSHMTP